MALISDAVHNLSDFTAVLVSYLALKISGKAPDVKQTFGYRRLEIFAAVFNVALLLGAGFYIAVESWRRLQNPEPIAGRLVIWIAAVAFLANLASTGLLHAGAKENLNIRGAFLHMLTDALMSLGIVVLGVIWLYQPWYWLDPLFSWLIVAVIVYSSWDILKHAFLIFMNATPPGIDIHAVQQEMEAIDGVLAIHHLHVWSLSEDSTALAVHILTDDRMLSEIDVISAAVRDMLLCKFNIDHPVLQFETQHTEESGIFCCPTNNHHG
jgi:cobalt-zinc-cadmium efflux system protein